MDITTPEDKATELKSAEVELEEVYTQLEDARKKLAEIKARTKSEESSADSASFGKRETAVSDPVFVAASSSETLIEGEAGAQPLSEDPAEVEVEEPATAKPVDGSPVNSEECSAHASDFAGAPYAEVPPQTPPASNQPYEPPPYRQAPPQTPPQQPYYQQPYYQPQYVQTKDHVAAGLLSIFFGSLGIHKFYLGYNTAGFIMLAVTIIGSLFTFGLAGAVMALIALIEGIIYLVKSQSEFEQIYVFNKREWF